MKHRTVDFAREIIPRVFGANLVAAAVVYVFLNLASPRGSGEALNASALEEVLFGGYVAFAVLVGLWVCRWTFAPVNVWLEEEREPSPDELAATLRQPFRQSLWILAGWALGAALFAVVHAIPANPLHYDPGYGLFIGAIGVLGGLAAAMLTYLLIEQSLRPVFALALESARSSRPRTLGIKQRITVAWALGSGVVLVAIALTPAASPRLAEAVLFLAPLGVVAGGVIIGLTARSVAAPVESVRDALTHVERGRFDVRVRVDDASEVGLLQAGFNRMAAGLEERERLRTIFGTYLDPDVADRILKGGTSLAGEEVEATIMFVDVRDFSTLAERSSAQEVVATANRLFERVVPIVHDHEGHVDKFVGDGLLAVFGTPRRRPDHATLAVRAAVAIERAVRDEFGDRLRVGIGVNSGRVVSGNVGGGGRLEFGVIGDAVNVAARIEAATRSTGDTILVSHTTRTLLDPRGLSLRERPGLRLKGKAEPVDLVAVEDSGDEPRAAPEQDDRPT